MWSCNIVLGASCPVLCLGYVCSVYMGFNAIVMGFWCDICRVLLCLGVEHDDIKFPTHLHWGRSDCCPTSAGQLCPHSHIYFLLVRGDVVLV
jgi:hypothetical protein